MVSSRVGIGVKVMVSICLSETCQDTGTDGGTALMAVDASSAVPSSVNVN